MLCKDNFIRLHSLFRKQAIAVQVAQFHLNIILLQVFAQHLPCRPTAWVSQRSPKHAHVIGASPIATVKIATKDTKERERCHHTLQKNARRMNDTSTHGVIWRGE